MAARPRKPWTRKTFPKPKKRRQWDKLGRLTPNANDARDILSEGEEPLYLDEQGRIYGFQSSTHMLKSSLELETPDAIFMWVWLPQKESGKFKANRKKRSLEDSLQLVDSMNILRFPEPGDRIVLSNYWSRAPFGSFTVIRLPESIQLKSVITSILIE